MNTGRQTLTSIYQTLQKAQQQAQEVEDRIQHATEEIVQLDRSAADHYRDLARFRVNLLAAGNIVQALDAGEQRVVQLLQVRKQAFDELLGKISDSAQQRLTLEAERNQQSLRVDEAAERLDKAEAATQQRLEQDEGYRQQLKKTREVERIAGHAEEKTQLAEQDRVDKGKPYEDDTLFSYLWERGFGTPKYHANPLTRLLDAWVARLVGYQDARSNYHMLLEIPARLHEHAQSVRASADQEYQTLEALELKAQEEDGIPPLQAALDEAEKELAENDAQLEQQQQSQQQLLEQKSDYLAGDDEYFRQMVELLAAEYRRDDIRTLRTDAQLTPLPEDDLVVEKLSHIEHNRQLARETMEQQRGLMTSHRQRIKELESVLNDFKRNRYDSVNSSFKNGDLLTMLLNQFLNGTVARGGLWREIQRQQRTRPSYSNPRFGTGGLGRGGSIWRGGGLGRGGSLGRGGFGRGGLGGGSFRTGGGF